MTLSFYYDPQRISFDLFCLHQKLCLYGSRRSSNIRSPSVFNLLMSFHTIHDTIHFFYDSFVFPTRPSVLKIPLYCPFDLGLYIHPRKVRFALPSSHLSSPLYKHGPRVLEKYLVNKIKEGRLIGIPS